MPRKIGVCWCVACDAATLQLKLLVRLGQRKLHQRAIQELCSRFVIKYSRASKDGAPASMLPRGEALEGKAAARILIPKC